MAVEFKPYDFSKLKPYTGSEEIFEESPKYVVQIYDDMFLWRHLTQALSGYCQTIGAVKTDNFFNLSLFTILTTRLKYSREATEITGHDRPLEEFKWWQQLVKTIKYENPSAREKLPLLEIRQ